MTRKDIDVDGNVVTHERDEGAGVTRPSVSVVIPCHNGAETLIMQLESLARQARGTPPFEVVIADNRSTDRLSDAVYRAGLHEWIDVRIAAAHEVGGASFARNVGVRNARADFLLFCDADDVVGERFVSFGMQTLEDVALFSASALPIRDDKFPPTVGEVVEFLDEPDVWSAALNDDPRDGIPVLMGGAFGIRRDEFLRLGGFDQSLPSAGEDNDFGLRAERSGLSISRSHCVKIAYRTTSDRAVRLEKIKRESRARALLVRRYGIDPDAVFPGWRFEPLRVVFAAAKSQILRSGPDVDRAIGERWASTSRFVMGMWEYGHPSRLPLPQVGVGLEDNGGR